MNRRGLAAQLKPSKITQEIYLLIDQGKYVGRTTSTKNALHFARLTEKGKSKVIVQLCDEEVLTPMSVYALNEKLIAEDYAKEMAKNQARQRKRMARESGNTKFGAFA